MSKEDINKELEKLKDNPIGNLVIGSLLEKGKDSGKMRSEEVEEAKKILKDEDCIWNYPERKILEANRTILNYISELEEKYKQINIEFTNKLIHDYIPKQVIRNKIEEIQNEYEETLKKSDFKEVEKMNRTNFKGITLEGQRSVLKELLGE